MGRGLVGALEVLLQRSSNSGNWSRSMSCDCNGVLFVTLDPACRNTYLLMLGMWRAVTATICWQSGRGKASVLWLMVDWLYFRRQGVPPL